MKNLKFWRMVIFLWAVVVIANPSTRAGAQQAGAPKQSAPAATSATVKEQAAGKETDTGEEKATPEQRAFAEKYVQSVQAEDVTKMRTLIPPTTLKCFDGDKQKFLDEWLEKQIRYGIPKDYKIDVSAIPPDTAGPSKMATYPVPRTHVMEFEYTAAANTITISQEIGREGGRWYLIPPCPTAARMAVFMKKEKMRAIAKDRAEHAYAELKEPLKSQLLALIAKHDNRGAMKLCVKSMHVDPTTAQFLLAKLAGDKID